MAVSDKEVQERGGAVIRRAIEEAGGSFVGVVAVMWDGELYRPPEFRMGPFPDGKSADRAARQFQLPDDLWERLDVTPPLNHVQDPEDEEEGPGAVLDEPKPSDDVAQAAVEETVAAQTEEREHEEAHDADGPETVQPEGSEDGPPAPASSWQERIVAAFAAHDKSETAFQEASRARDAAVLDAYEAEDGAETYRDIADLVGVTHQTIQSMARRERKRRVNEETEES